MTPRLTGPAAPLPNVQNLANAFELPSDGWYQLSASGEFKHNPTGLLQLIDAAALDAIAARFAADATAPNFPGVLIDFDHFSLDRDKPSEAAGWIQEIQHRPEAGLWGRIRWSDKGEEAVRGGRYRFISPVWRQDDCEQLANGKVRPRRLCNAAVTNDPNIGGMVPLSNAAGTSPAPVAPRPATRLSNRAAACLAGGLLANAGGPQSDQQRKAMFARMGQSGGPATVRKTAAPAAPAAVAPPPTANPPGTAGYDAEIAKKWPPKDNGIYLGGSRTFDERLGRNRTPEEQAAWEKAIGAAQQSATAGTFSTSTLTATPSAPAPGIFLGGSERFDERLGRNLTDEELAARRQKAIDQNDPANLSPIASDKYVAGLVAQDQAKAREQAAAVEKARLDVQKANAAAAEGGANTTREWGVALPGFVYPAVEGPGNPGWEKRHPEKNPQAPAVPPAPGVPAVPKGGGQSVQPTAKKAGGKERLVTLPAGTVLRGAITAIQTGAAALAPGRQAAMTPGGAVFTRNRHLANAGYTSDEQRKAMFARMAGGGGARRAIPADPEYERYAVQAEAAGVAPGSRAAWRASVDRSNAALAKMEADAADPRNEAGITTDTDPVSMFMGDAYESVRETVEGKYGENAAATMDRALLVLGAAAVTRILAKHIAGTKAAAEPSEQVWDAIEAQIRAKDAIERAPFIATGNPTSIEAMAADRAPYIVREAADPGGYEAWLRADAADAAAAAPVARRIAPVYLGPEQIPFVPATRAEQKLVAAAAATPDAPAAQFGFMGGGTIGERVVRMAKDAAEYQAQAAKARAAGKLTRGETAALYGNRRAQLDAAVTAIVNRGAQSDAQRRAMFARMAGGGSATAAHQSTSSSEASTSTPTPYGEPPADPADPAAPAAAVAPGDLPPRTPTRDSAARVVALQVKRAQIAALAPPAPVAHDYRLVDTKALRNDLLRQGKSLREIQPAIAEAERANAAATQGLAYLEAQYKGLPPSQRKAAMQKALTSIATADAKDAQAYHKAFAAHQAKLAAIDLQIRQEEIRGQEDLGAADQANARAAATATAKKAKDDAAAAVKADLAAARKSAAERREQSAVAKAKTDKAAAARREKLAPVVATQDERKRRVAYFDAIAARDRTAAEQLYPGADHAKHEAEIRKQLPRPDEAGSPRNQKTYEQIRKGYEYRIIS